MGHSSIRAKVRRRKVTALAAYSKKFSVKNNTIPPVEKDNLVEIKKHWGTIFSVKGSAEFKIPEEGYPQSKSLRKKYKKKYYCKGTHTIRKIVEHTSDYANFPDHIFRPKGIAWYCEQLVQHKTAQWEKKNPRPIKENVNEPDLFEAQYIPQWEAKRDAVIERFRDVVVSKYYKLEVLATVTKPGGPPFKEIPIGTVAYTKDAVTEATKIAKSAMKENPDILHCQIKGLNGKDYQLVA